MNAQSLNIKPTLHPKNINKKMPIITFQGWLFYRKILSLGIKIKMRNINKTTVKNSGEMVSS